MKYTMLNQVFDVSASKNLNLETFLCSLFDGINLFIIDYIQPKIKHTKNWGLS